MEIIFEFILEFICGLYIIIFESLFPNKKLKNWQRKLLSAFCLIIFVVALFALFAGIECFTEKDNKLGTILTSVGGGVILLHIIIAIIAYKLKKKSKPNSEDPKFKEVKEIDTD